MQLKQFLVTGLTPIRVDFLNAKPNEAAGLIKKTDVGRRLNLRPRTIDQKKCFY